MADQGLLKGFKDFVLRGNVVDLAVAVVIGAAFSAVIKAVVDGFINPLISAIFGENSLATVAAFKINGSQFSLGLILAAIVNFLAVAAVVYFLVVVPLNRLMARFASGEEAISTPDPQVELLKEIRDLLAAPAA